jgi:hypothetical protein
LAKGKKALPHDGGNNARIVEGKKTKGGNYHP